MDTSLKDKNLYQTS